MFGRRTAYGVGCFVLGLAPCLGCGGSVVRGSGEGEGAAPAAGTSGDGGRGGAGGSRTDGGTPAFGGGAGQAGGSAGSGGSLDPEPVDTSCPPEERPPPDLQCDPFVAGACGPGEGCYPFVDHPEGGGCDQQRYGTVCGPAGTGTQGASCGGPFGDDWCAPGFVCVVGQRAGKRCAALCELGATGQCAGGLICGELDVAGFGVCG